MIETVFRFTLIALFGIGVVIVAGFIVEKLVDQPINECTLKCNQLGYGYFKYEQGGFSDSNCWCRKNDTTEQIW